MPMIRIWVYDGILSSGVAGPVDVFAAANRLAAKDAPVRSRCHQPFVWRVESLDGRPVHASSGRTVAVDGGIDARKRAAAILVTAPFVADMERFLSGRRQLRVLASALRRQHKGGAVIASYCTGSYLLAEAGLLDGRVATTHWAKAADFQHRYPKVALRANEVVTEQDRILCGGGGMSFLKLALQLVEKLADARLAAATAKALLIDTNRISQAAYATLLTEHGHTDRLVARAQRRMEATLQHGFSLSELAADLAVSERTLHRRFKQAVGEAPLVYLQALRVEVAKRLLESGEISVEDVSRRVGYGDLSTFRQLFKRKTHLSPREYQLRFARAESNAAEPGANAPG